MSQAEARAWWADVEHLREPLERRRVAHAPAGSIAGRRTVKIRGQAVAGAPARPLHVVPAAPSVALPARSTRRPPRRAVDWVGGRPDRIAGWAVFLGLLLAGVAAVSGNG